MKKPLAIVGALAAIGMLPLAAQTSKSWTSPRTPDGHPDLQGTWNNATLTPLERPARFAGKLTLTPAEAAAYEKQILDENNMDRRDGGAEADLARAYNDTFHD